MEHAKDELQSDVECIAACEVLQWPDCGGSNTLTHPTPNSVRSILVNNTAAKVVEGRLGSGRPASGEGEGGSGTPKTGFGGREGGFGCVFVQRENM